MLQSKNCGRMDLVKLACWSRGRVVLVGDAAYCPPAMTGMSTTSGIAGVYFLAGEIGRHCDGSSGKNFMEGNDTIDAIMGALQEYEQMFRPFIRQLQEMC